MTDLAENDPNVDVSIVVVFFYALRDIQIGEELTCCYGWPVGKALPRKICRCGSLNCSGLVVVRGFAIVEDTVVDGDGDSGNPIGMVTTVKFCVL